MPISPHEDRVGGARHTTVECAHTKVTHRADHVLELHEVGTPYDAEDDGRNKGTEETFNCFLGGELDQRCTTDSDAPDVREDVVADHKGGRDPEPDHALEDIVDDEVTERLISERYLPVE